MNNKPLRILLSLCIAFLSNSARSQGSSPSGPGSLTLSDFAPSSALITPATNAVVLTDIGNTTLDNADWSWQVHFRRFKRIKILSLNGLDAGTVSISFPEDDNNNMLKHLKACTYNEKDGNIETTPVNPKDIFLERDKKSGLKELRFAFPKLQVGSIIEYSYTVTMSDVDNLHSWNFQTDYPVLYSEYSVVLPEMFNYIVTVKGGIPFFKTVSDSVKKTIWVGTGNTEHMIYIKTWIMKDVPPIKKEEFVNCMDNQISKIHFQLSAYPVRYTSHSTGILPNWQNLADHLLVSPYFGAPLADKNNWLHSQLDTITAGCRTKLEQAQKLYAYIRDRFSCTGNGISLNSTLSQISTARQGNTAEINLLLIAMLRKLDLHADPVLLCTKDQGISDSTYPVLENINYVVARLTTETGTFYLDAATKGLGFGRLPVSCYNGHARIIKKVAEPVFFRPDSLKESSVIIASMSNNETGGQTIRFDNTAGYYESVDLRKTLSEKDSGDYFQSLTHSFPYHAELTSHSVNSLIQYENPVNLQYTLDLKIDTGRLLYFNPMLNAVLDKNPYPADDRRYPVDLPYTTNQVYVLNMQIPKGYTIEELPKSIRANFNDKDGMFEYLIGTNEDQIQFRCRLLINKTFFDADQYDNLRNFYDMVLKKESENIVFKKIAG